MSRAQVMVDAGLSVKVTHGITGTVDTAVTAAGSDETDATLLTADNNLISTASEGEGVILPAFSAGTIWVANGTDVNVYVYPASGMRLNNQTADLPLDMPPWSGAIFKAVDATNVLVIF